MTEIHQLHPDPDAQHMRVAFDKGINYLNSFFALFDTKRKEVGDAKLGDWCFYQLRISLSIVNKISEVLDDTDRVRVQDSLKQARELEKQQAVEKREAEKAAAEQQKKEAEIKKHEADLKALKDREARALELAAQKVKTEAAEAEAKPTKQTKSKSGKKRASPVRKQSPTTIATPDPNATGMNDTLANLLVKASQVEESLRQVERSHRVELGGYYFQMREEVQVKHSVGIDPATNKNWSWVKWQDLHIQRGRTSVSQLIKEYEEATKSNDKTAKAG